jgi:hypothetical protein
MSEPAIIKKKKIIKKKPVVAVAVAVVSDADADADADSNTTTNISEPPHPVFKTPIDEYIETFTELEKKAFSIAKDHLKTSFDLKRSCGFVAWNKSGGK